MDDLSEFGRALDEGNVETAVSALSRVRSALLKLGDSRADRVRAMGDSLKAYQIARACPDHIQAALHEALNESLPRRSRSLIGAIRRGVTPSFEYDPENERKRHNRDVRAMNWLLDQRIDPEKIFLEAAKPGGGPEGWARAQSAARAEKAAEEAEAAARAIKAPPQLRSAVRLMWADDKGKLLGVQDFSATLKPTGRLTSTSWAEVEKYARRQQLAERRSEALGVTRSRYIYNDPIRGT